MVRIAPPLGSSPSRSRPISIQRAVNCYAQAAPEGSKVPFWMVGAPGLKAAFTLPDSPIRAMAVWDSDTSDATPPELYVIAGEGLYRVHSDLTFEQVTAPAIPDGQVYMSPGNFFLVWTAGGLVFALEGATGTVTQVVTPDDIKMSSVDFIDGFWVFTQENSGKFYTTTINDPREINALDFATAESRPDNTVRVLVTHRELWLFGEDSTEVWTNVGAADFPFAPYLPASIDRGIGAAASAANLDNTSFWLGEDYIVYRADGYTPVRISNHELEKRISESPAPQLSTGFTWTQEGHVFYALSIPDIGAWVYDAATQQWHERETFDRPLLKWRVSCYEKAFRRHFAGDDTTGNVWEFDFATFSDGGGVLHREVYSPTIWGEDSRFTTDRLQADFEVGVGLNDGQGSDPQAMLQWTSDGGWTWSNEHWRTIGPIGARFARVIWRRLGQARQRVYRMRVTDPVAVNFAGWTADFVEEDV